MPATVWCATAQRLTTARRTSTLRYSSASADIGSNRLNAISAPSMPRSPGLRRSRASPAYGKAKASFAVDAPTSARHPICQPSSLPENPQKSLLDLAGGGCAWRMLPECFPTAPSHSHHFAAPIICRDVCRNHTLGGICVRRRPLPCKFRKRNSRPVFFDHDIRIEIDAIRIYSKI